jgi:hypothetical protein
VEKFAVLPLHLQGRSWCFIYLIVKVAAYAADSKAVICAHLQFSASQYNNKSK